MNINIQKIFIISAVPIGIISYFIHQIVGNSLVSLIFGVICYIILREYMKRKYNINKPNEFWMNNGGWNFFFVWFVTWTFAFNIIGGL